MTHSSVFAFMGGTFDPIHNGHLRSALEIQQWLDIEQVCLIPAKIPVHRAQPGCTSEQRLQMVRTAVSDVAELNADAREILSEYPSYSLLTLQSLRAELGVSHSICMIMGMDAFLSLPQWHNWQQFMSLCHILVMKRPGYPFQPCQQLQAFLAQHQTQRKHDVLTKPAGHVLLHEQTPLEISATQIRQLIGQNLSPRYLLPDNVWRYIKQHNLYVERT